MRRQRQQHRLQQHMGHSTKAKTLEGMIRHVIVMGMISIIALRLEVIEIARDLARRPGGIEDVNLRLVVAIALCTVNMVMIAMVEGAITADGVEQHEVAETDSASEALIDSVGAQVQPHAGGAQVQALVQNSHCQLQALNGSSMNRRLAKAISKVRRDVNVNVSSMDVTDQSTVLSRTLFVGGVT